MRSIWNSDNARVIITGINTVSVPAFEGTIYRAVVGKKVILGTWVAYPTPEGYKVYYYRLDGTERGMYTGPTYNLGLEVASGLKYSQL